MGIFALMNDIKITRWPGGQWNQGKKNFQKSLEWLDLRK